MKFFEQYHNLRRKLIDFKNVVSKAELSVDVDLESFKIPSTIPERKGLYEILNVVDQRLNSIKESLEEQKKYNDVNNEGDKDNSIDSLIARVNKMGISSIPGLVTELVEENQCLMRVMRLTRIKADDVNGLLEFMNVDGRNKEVDLQDYTGNTILNDAVHYCSKKITVLLLNKGANPFLENKIGKSTFSYALEKADIGLVKRCVDFAKTKTMPQEQKEQSFLGDLINILETTQSESEYIYKIVKNVRTPSIYEALGLSQIGAEICHTDAKIAYDILGKGSTDFSDYSDAD